MKELLSQISINPMIYDNGLLMAIVAINMTVIGLSSLADSKCIIGVDYGRFLITKFKLLGIRMYYWIILFALINIGSLFVMFAKSPTIRIINFILLILSLIFAIFYFFGFILVENRWVQKQIYKSELLGLYCDDNNTEHMEIDKLVNMNPGNRTNNKLSTNVINYFNVFNAETQIAFMKAFGPDSIIYSDNKNIAKYRMKKFNIKKYNYRISNTDAKIKEISFEFFQLFRYCEMQDKWAIDIIKIFNGEPSTYKNYDVFRLYNLARLLVNVTIFGVTENLNKYKFAYYMKDFLYSTVDKSKNEMESESEIKHIKEVEKYMIRALAQYFANSINQYDNIQFKNFVQNFLKEIILDYKYKGYLEVQEILKSFIDVSISFNCDELKNIIDRSLSLFYNLQTKKAGLIDIEDLRKYVENKLSNKDNKLYEVTIFPKSQNKSSSEADKFINFQNMCVKDKI